MNDEHRTIFLYEDDRSLASEIVLAFATEFRNVTLLEQEEEVETVVRNASASAIIMDRMVDGADSLELIERLRAEGCRTPVVVISSLSSVDERIRGLRAGGDDYLVKPFAMDELVARVDAVCRRAKDDRRMMLTVGPLVMDLIERTVRRDDRPIELLPREFGLLEYLMRHSGQLVTRTMLLEEVWNYHAAAQTNVVDVHVGHLRRKVDADGERQLIISVRGRGFTLKV